MIYAIHSDRGDLLGEWSTSAEAVAVLDQIIAEDPGAADELAVFAFDEKGERIGEPIIRSASTRALTPE
jgi:hypothetical protein